MMDLVDNFEVLADALLKAFLPSKAKRSYSLDKVLRKITEQKHKNVSILKRRSAKKKDPLWKLAALVENVVDEIRDAEYGGWSADEDELLENAQEIRQSVFDEVDELIRELAARAT